MLNLVVGIGMWIGIWIGIGSLFLTYGATMIKYLILAGTMALTACGGGGGGAATVAPVVTAAAAEGMWDSKTASGVPFSLLVLETGQAFAFYLKAAAPQPIDGVLFGSPTISGTTISGAINDWNFTSKTLTAETMSGTAVAKTSMALTFVRPTATFTSTGTYDKSYDNAVTLAAVAGVYTGKSGTGDTFGASVSSTFTISAAGTFTVINTSTGCVINGSLKPRASGKNVLDTTLTFTGAGCLLGDGAVTTGAAIFDATAKGLSWITVNAGKTNVFVFVGTKP